MQKLKWYFKHGTKFEEFSVLYEDEKFMLVQNDKTKTYSFGVKEDFGTLLGFPVNWSCLTVDKAEDVLKGLIEVDTQYLDTLGEIAENNIKRWENMILSLKVTV